MKLLNRRSCYYSPLSRNYISLNKLWMLLLTILFIVVYLICFNENFEFCNPGEALWWFCPWPDPKTTVCSWDKHFPLINPKHRFDFICFLFKFKIVKICT